MNKRREENKLGMTLVEVLISMVFVSMLVAVVYVGTIQGLRTNYMVAQRVAAYGMCRQGFELLRGADYNSINSSTFTNEQITLTHCGGMNRVPLKAQRSYSFNELTSPKRKATIVTVTWNYMGISNAESAVGVIYDKDDTSDVEITGDIAGSININPNNRPDYEFELTYMNGSTVDRDDLKQTTADFSGLAKSIRVRPKGNGNQNSLLLNGQPYSMLNSVTYIITGSNITFNVYNDHRNYSGKAVGHWWIDLTGTGVKIDTL